MFHLIPSIIQLISIQLSKTCSIFLSSVILLSFANSFASQPEWILSGTFISTSHSHAMFVDTYGDELLLERGDEIQGCNLVDVLKDSAKIRCNDNDYLLLIRSSVGDVLLQAKHEKLQTQNQTVFISKTEISDYVKQKQRFVSEIGFLPLVEGEQVVGYTLSKIKPDTQAAELGLYNGDVVKSVNGVPATESDLFMQAVHDLADSSEITLEVDRYGKLMAYTYILE